MTKVKTSPAAAKTNKVKTSINKKVKAPKIALNNTQVNSLINKGLIKPTKTKTVNVTFEAKKRANNAWKEDTYSIFGIINYIVKNYNKSEDLKEVLNNCIPNDANNKTKQDIKDALTVDYIKGVLGEKGLYQWKADEDGKRTIKGDPKTKFSLWAVMSAIIKNG
jgi:hypothetical protein